VQFAQKQKLAYANQMFKTPKIPIRPKKSSKSVDKSGFLAYNVREES
jgi:hypothetical protein